MESVAKAAYDALLEYDKLPLKERHLEEIYFINIDQRTTQFLADVFEKLREPKKLKPIDNPSHGDSNKAKADGGGGVFNRLCGRKQEESLDEKIVIRAQQTSAQNDEGSDIDLYTQVYDRKTK